MLDVVCTLPVVEEKGGRGNIIMHTWADAF